jgi:phosphoribosylaminoimidazolecarboxamide formyltransferase/IMP cyclohydrolase
LGLELVESKKRALISVNDKKGIADFARKLVELGYEIVSTGGTFKELHEAEIPVTRISELTGFPEILDGRVKTLHPVIHGGVLARRTNEHLEELKTQDIEPFEMVVVNLYPFEQVALKKDASDEEIIENIDIGGPALIRAASKNFENVIILISPDQYEPVIMELSSKGEVSLETRKELAISAFLRTCTYDKAIMSEFEKRFSVETYPKDLLLHFEKVTDLRYGENPHQSSAFYTEQGVKEKCVTNARQLHGKMLSFNNILDINDALELVKDFEEPTATIVKHTNPCGVASADNILTAYEQAMAADPMAAFGGVIAVNRPLTIGIAQQISKIFVEGLIAPSYEPGTLDILTKKKNIRLMETGEFGVVDGDSLDFKRVIGGLLVQDRNLKHLDVNELPVTSERAPTRDELASMDYAWHVIKHVKSNSIVFAKGRATVGIGAGQMSRVDAVKIASFKAEENAKGCALASDAFFPFRDGIDEAAKAGVTAVIQPGGSIRDKEVIEAVNEHNMAMLFTGTREFKH